VSSNGNVVRNQEFSDDPRFEDPDGGDYHLSSTSPAIDRAIDSVVVDDIDGDPRPVGSAPDVGADEWRTCYVRLNDDPTEYWMIQPAVDLSDDPSDVVKVAGYCTMHGQSGDPPPVVYITKTLTIQGGYSRDFSVRDTDVHTTTLDGLEERTVAYIAGEDGPISPQMDGLKLINGYNIDYGAGIYSWNASPTITDCEVSNGRALDGGAGIYLYQSPDAVLSNVRLFDNDGDDDPGGGIVISDSDGVLIEASEMARNTGSDGGAVFVSGSGHALLRSNVIYTNTATNGGGIFAIDSPYLTVVGSNIYTNTAAQEWLGGGIYVEGSPHTVVSENRLAGNDGGYEGGALYALTSDYISVTLNNVYSNTAILEGGGIKVVTSSLAYVGHNRIYDNEGTVGAGGLALRGSYSTTIDSNLIHENTGLLAAGMYVDASPSALIVNNMIWMNEMQYTEKSAGIQLWSEEFITPCNATILHNTIISNTGGEGAAIHVALEEPSTVVISNTIIVSHSIGVTVTAGNTVIMDGMLWGTGDAETPQEWGGEGTAIVGPVSIREDPGFVDPLARDYHLAQGSAAVDAGIMTWLDVDIDGDPRPGGLQPDIGADELEGPAYSAYMPLVLRSSSGAGSDSRFAYYKRRE
jgi:hypothetical protein